MMSECQVKTYAASLALHDCRQLDVEPARDNIKTQHHRQQLEMGKSWGWAMAGMGNGWEWAMAKNLQMEVHSHGQCLMNPIHVLPSCIHIEWLHQALLV